MIFKKRRFEEHIRYIMEHATPKDYEKALLEVGKAMLLPDLDNVRIWQLNFWKTILSYLYLDDWEWDEKCEEIWELRRYAVCYLKDDADQILWEYVQLTYYFLSMQAVNPMYLLDYEETAQEFYDLVNAVDFSRVTDMDYCSYANLIMGTICGLKGRIILQERYLGQILEDSKGKEGLTYDAVAGIYNLAETKSALGKRDEERDIYLYLLDLIFGEDVRIYCQNSIQQDDLKGICQNTLLGLMEIAGQEDRPEPVVRILEPLLLEPDVNRILRRETDDATWQLGIYYLQAMHALNRIIDPDTLDIITEIMTQVTEEQMHLELSYSLLQFYDIGCYFLAKARKEPDPVRYMDKVLKIGLNEKAAERDRGTYLSFMQTVCHVYRLEHQDEKAAECAKDILKKLIRFYSLAELDQDNSTLEQYLTICNNGFMTAYAALHEELSLEERLMYRLNYKNMSGSVIRLRNQCENAVNREKREDEFPFYTYEQLVERLPENSAALDFYYVNNRLAKETIALPSIYEDAVLEVILVKKTGSTVSIHGSRITDIGYLEERISKLMNVIQSNGGKYQKIAKTIYALLLGKFTQEFANVEQIFLAPDHILNNVPFELLFEASEIAGVGSVVVYLASLRNLFEQKKETYKGQSACVIGSPIYQVGEDLTDTLEPEERRALDAQLPPLPYSGYEAQKAALALSGFCFRKEQATKYVIKPGYRYLHIATHGLVPSEYENPWYESVLAFSGAVDYRISGQEREGYGNGLLSAEEISRMKLDDTELAVLSACNSGKSLLSGFLQQSGLHIAFGAAGVKYIISSLWKVDDLAAVFLMSFFYQTLKEGASVPQALQAAKCSVKNITAGGILRIVEQDISFCPELSDDLLQWLQSLPEQYCLYEAPYFWSAFVCYQYKF